MDRNGFYFLLIILSRLTLLVLTEPVNVALNKETRGIFTCSTFGKEYYRNLSNKDRRQEVHVCDSLTTHPPSAMVDGNVTTKWQSVSKFRISYFGIANLTALTPPGRSNLHGVIYIDLKQVFNVESMSLMMGDAKRPNQMVVYKSTTSEEGGGSYRPWVYRVTWDNECQTKFSHAVGDMPTSTTASICTRYNNPTATGLETVTFDFKHVTESALREWKTARFIKIELYDMPMPLGFEGDIFQHFAISEWVVMAECVCNGHQTGCELNPTTGTFECKCGGNTFGSFCELCKPMFNQQPFSYGVPCESCNCFNHSIECSYDAAVAANNKSLNIRGQLSGGGVCSACQDHTAGVNCELCVATYFRPAGRDQTAADACVPCECVPAGSIVSPLSGIKDDCVTNSDVILIPPKDPGFCWCKDNVEGNKCQRCKTGFYNMRAENAQGCQACECNEAGTVGSSQACAPDETGQCSCKANTEGRACDSCKNEFYQLDIAKSDGCSACECDPGGALSPVCHKVSGQCTCRPNLSGRQCDSPDQGFYYPSLYFINAQFERNFDKWEKNETMGVFFGDGYAVTKNGDKLDVMLSFPGGTTFSGVCTVVIRYKTDEATSLTVEITASDNPIPAQVNMALCPTTGTTWCYAQVDSRNFTLTPGPHSTTVRVSGAALLDQIVCIPVEFLDSEPVLKSSAFAARCDVIQNDMKAGSVYESTCNKGVFSLMMYYMNGPRFCACNVDGSSSVFCNRNGGQCQCKAGVGGRQCDTCLPGFFNLTSVGCQACNCKGSNPVCDKIIGQCSCPPNTMGRQCDMCNPYFYAWDGVNGCQACDCNRTGSSSLQCNLTDGNCICKTGVIGKHCSSCADGNTNFSPSGCTDCGCSPVGSASPVCDRQNGQCTCRDNVEGKLCTGCKVGSFYMEKQNPKGCLDCICMGVVTNCHSSPQLLQRKSFLLASSSSGGELSTVMKMTDRAGTPIQNATLMASVSFTLTVRAASDGRVYLEAALDGQTEVFWRMPSELQGNLLGIYGSKIEADVTYSAGTPISRNAILIGRNNVRLVHRFAPLESANVTKPLVVSLTEADWVEEGTSANVTRGKFLLAISDTKMILMPARHASSPHKTSLSRLEYSLVGTNGLPNPAVEACQCGPQYRGLSCEDCAPGFKRANLQMHPYLGMCVPCECHGHTGNCDPNTGVCVDCQHNTTGDNCEVCKTGFYGDATVGTSSDCIPCPCHDPRVVNKTCTKDNNNIIKCSFCQPGYIGHMCDQCDTFYYGNAQITGGTCTRCDCHGNSDACDKISGICQNCQNNTVGSNCERCMDSFYGNASLQNCAACGCDNKGSISLVCNFTSGECPCHPGVGKRNCDACQTNYYGFSNDSFTGCQACGCNELGSSLLQCMPDSGNCVCKQNVVSGGKCDACSPGYFGLPDKACEACSCNSTGSVGGATAACDAGSGVCPCKPGVTGRACDQCLPLYTDFGEQGCTVCGRCEKTLGEDSARLANMWTSYYNTSQKVLAIQAQDKVLQGLQQQLTDTQGKLGMAGTTSGSSSGSTGDLANNITHSETAANRTVSDLQNKAVTLEGVVVTLKDGSVGEWNRINGLMTTAQTTLDLVKSENQKAFNYEVRLKEFNTIAAQYHTKSQVTGSLGLDFTAEQQRANEDLKVIQNDTRMQSMESQILGQTTNISSLKTKAENLKTEFTTVIQQITAADKTLDDLTSQKTTVTIAVNAAKLSKDASDALISQVQTSLASAQGITTTENILQTVLKTKSDVDSILRGNVLTVLPELAPLPAGITNLEDGSSRLADELVNTQAQLDSAKNLVEQAESKANTLQVHADLINSTFRAVVNRGEAAVKAIKNYEQVISTLESSKTTSVDANKTIENARAFLSGITVSVLSNNASSSKQRSEDLLLTLNNINYKPEVLQSLLTNGKTGLQMAKAKWKIVDQQLDQMNMVAQALNTHRTENAIQQKIANAKDIATRGENLARSVKTNADAELVSLNSKGEEVDGKKGQAIQTNNLIAKVENDLQTLRQNASAITNNIQQINNQKAEIFSRKTRLDTKMADIESKLAQARQLLGKIRQPIHFNGSMSVVTKNNVANFGLPYSDVSLYFRKDAGQIFGLLFFSENTASPAHLSLKLVNDRVVFDFNNGAEFISIQNPAEICEGCWVRAQASRYENTGYLTVTLLNTGGFASQWKKGIQAQRTMNLNSKLMFGQLPPGYTTTKYSGAGFLGCMQNVKFNGEDVNIWSEAVLSGQSAQCCKQLVTVKPVLPAGTSFNGFGYLVLSGTGTDMSQLPITVSIQFRTWNPSATILYIATSDRSIVYTIYLDNGRVVIDYRVTNIARVRISSGSKFNSGEWVQVTGIHQAQNHEVKIVVLDQSDANRNEDIVRNSDYSADFSALSGQDIVLGASNHPNHVSYQINSKNFGGCMKNLAYKFGSGALVSRSLSQGIVLQKGVSFVGCASTILPGVGFTKIDSYAELKRDSSLLPITSIQFQLITLEPQGVILYLKDPQMSTRVLYLGLFHGNLILLYSQTSARMFSVTTMGRYLSDGQQHDVKINFTQRRAQLMLNGTVYEQTAVPTLSNPRFDLSVTTPIYIGGVPDNSVLNSEYPARKSFVGAVRSLIINNRLVDLINAGSFQSYNNIDLSGVPAPPSELPPPPYSTMMPLTTFPPPTCAAPLTPTYLPQYAGIWFKGNAVFAVDVSSKTSLFLENFAMSIKFAAFHPDGLLLFVANSYQQSSQWLAIYLNNGKIAMEIKGVNFSETLTSEFTYNDGIPHRVDFLVMNRYFVLVEPLKKEYVSNSQDGLAQPAAFNSITTDLFLGGRDNRVAFGQQVLSHLPGGFVGAIYKCFIKVNDANSSKNLEVDWRSPKIPLADGTTGEIPTNAYYGLSLSGDNSFVKLGEFISLVNMNLTVKVNFSTTQVSASLFGIYMFHNRFVVLELANHWLRVVMAYNKSFEVTVYDSTNLCDGTPHSVSMSVGPMGVEIQIDDSFSRTYAYTPDFIPPEILNTVAYFGGFENPANTFSKEVVKEHLRGCLLDIVVNGKKYDTALLKGFSRGTVYGCPY
ncbi:laminin subunit alpha-2-like [Gigantopelta aegis]|uniref:laminin subunit alpha-2-like n=1 Tax=Gigantopelta aegis TaxID=1735272 RepID=UPI001B8884CC|nr:laminin subunit alpha-2-like [Gigantopelta aegis]